MDEQMQKLAGRLQDSLSTLRKVAGWSAEDLGRQLDVTRQTIVNLETGQTKLTKIQYLAIRAVFAARAQEMHDGTLAALLSLLVDSDRLDGADRTRIQSAVEGAAASVGRRAGAAAASGAAITALAALLAASTMSLAGPLAASVAASSGFLAHTQTHGSGQDGRRTPQPRRTARGKEDKP